MNRRFSNFVAAMSLALFAVVAVLWTRSFASETILLESHRGQCLLIGIDCSPKAVREARDAVTLDQFLTSLTVPLRGLIIGATGLPPPPPREHRGLGFLLVRGDWCEIRVPATDTYRTPPFWI